MTSHRRFAGVLKAQVAVVALPRTVKTYQLTAMMKDCSITAKKIMVGQKEDPTAPFVHQIIKVSHVNEIWKDATRNRSMERLVVPLAVCVAKALADRIAQSPYESNT